jgi:FkbM family methyltransferase
MAKTTRSTAKSGAAAAKVAAALKAAVKPGATIGAKSGSSTRKKDAAAKVAPELAPPLAAPLEIVARCHGIEVPASPHLGPGMIRSLEAGKYESGEIAAGLACIPKGARILELGAGAGVVGAVLAKHLSPAAMMSVEANPRMIPNIAELHRHNGLDAVIDLRHAVVFSAPDAPETVEFFLRGNFLGSSLTPLNEERAVPVAVPVMRYADLAAEFPHEAIMMDIEGGELEFLRHADLSAVQVVVGEFHRMIYGREGMKECRQLLSKAGFQMDEAHSRPGIWVWRRS